MDLRFSKFFVAKLQLNAYSTLNFSKKAQGGNSGGKVQ